MLLLHPICSVYLSHQFKWSTLSSCVQMSMNLLSVWTFIALSLPSCIHPQCIETPKSRPSDPWRVSEETHRNKRPELVTVPYKPREALCTVQIWVFEPPSAKFFLLIPPSCVPTALKPTSLSEWSLECFRGNAPKQETGSGDRILRYKSR